MIDHVTIETAIPRSQVAERVVQLSQESPPYRIFDKEIEYRGALVIQRLFNQRTNIKIRASKCQLVENVPANEELKQFCIDNHASGWRETITAADCLYHDGILVYAFLYDSYGVIHRLCALKGFAVQGGYSRLMKRLTQKFESIKTFANLRWGFPKIYSDLKCKNIGYQEVVFENDLIVWAKPEHEFVYVDGPILEFTS